MTITIPRALLEQAIEAFECLKKGDVSVWALGGSHRSTAAEEALRAALAAPDDVAE